jgi:release factor glutamine methyltransferase
MNPITIGRLIDILSRRFSSLSESPSLDAQVLIAHIVHRSRAWVLAHTEYELSPPECEALEKASSKAENGMPLPYVLGSWEFYGRKFYVTPAVLIPRPETELLVEKALDWVDNYDKEKSNENLLVADIGCGSGCIGISLAMAHPHLQVLASDISCNVLSVAQRNAIFHSVISQLHLVQCNLIPAISKRFHLICANLPYIPTQILAQLKVYQKEPTQALDGGLDGLDFIKQLLYASPKYLAPDGLMLLEIGAMQGESVKYLAQAAFPNAVIDLYCDLAGYDRLIAIQQG